jgi:hypothetical protein
VDYTIEKVEKQKPRRGWGGVSRLLFCCMKSFTSGVRWGNCKSSASQVMLFAVAEWNKSEMRLSPLTREGLSFRMIDVRGYNCHRVLQISD